MSETTFYKYSLKVLRFKNIPEKLSFLWRLKTPRYFGSVGEKPHSQAVLGSGLVKSIIMSNLHRVLTKP